MAIQPLVPAKAGSQGQIFKHGWISAFAGMTGFNQPR
jgi:hypothetical protein